MDFSDMTPENVAFITDYGIDAFFMRMSMVQQENHRRSEKIIMLNTAYYDNVYRRLERTRKRIRYIN